MVVLRECAGENHRDRDLGLRFVGVVFVTFIPSSSISVVWFGEVREDGGFRR